MSRTKQKPHIPDIPTVWLVGITIGLIALVGLFVIFFLHTEILLILFAGIFLGTAIKPLVVKLNRRGIPKEIGATLVFFSLLAVVGLFIRLALPLLANQTADLTDIFSQGYADLYENLSDVPNVIIHQFLRTLPKDLMEFGAGQTSPDSGATANTLAAFGQELQQILGTALGIIFVFFLAIYWAVEEERFKLIAVLLSNQQRDFIQSTYDRLEKRISHYLNGVGLLSLIVGGASFIGYLLLGLPYALVLGVFAGIMEAVPMIGPTIGAIPAFIIGLSISPSTAIAVVVITVIIQAVENTWLFSRVMGSSTGVPPFVTLIALAAFSSLFGAAGALLAIPIAAVFQVLYEAIVEHRRSQVSEDIGRDWIGSLRYQIKELVRDISTKSRDDQPEVQADLDHLQDTLESIAMDLDTLLQRTANEELP